MWKDSGYYKGNMLLTDLPMYLYHNNELPSRGDGALFHFTSWEKFKLIMNDLSLLPSAFGNLNDLNEANINNMNMSENFMVMYDAERYIKERCRLLCFSQNYEINGVGQEGTNHPAMWAHYADNSVIALQYNDGKYDASAISTYGLDASTILQLYMGKKARVAEVEIRITELFDLIDGEDYEKANSILNELEKEFGDTIPEIIQARTMLDFNVECDDQDN